MEALTPGHLLLLLVGFVVLFGYKKLPDASRSLGRSLRIFRTEMRAMNGDDAPSDRTDGATAADGASVAVALTSLEAEAAAAEARAMELRARAQEWAARRHPAS